MEHPKVKPFQAPIFPDLTDAAARGACNTHVNQEYRASEYVPSSVI
jgi:hypothetical protein